MSSISNRTGSVHLDLERLKSHKCRTIERTSGKGSVEHKTWAIVCFVNITEYFNTFNGTYAPHLECDPQGREKWAQIVLTWRAEVAGRQFDRLAGVWVGGVEVRNGTEVASKTSSCKV